MAHPHTGHLRECIPGALFPPSPWHIFIQSQLLSQNYPFSSQFLLHFFPVPFSHPVLTLLSQLLTLSISSLLVTSSLQAISSFGLQDITSFPPSFCCIFSQSQVPTQFLFFSPRFYPFPFQFLPLFSSSPPPLHSKLFPLSLPVIANFPSSSCPILSSSYFHFASLFLPFSSQFLLLPFRFPAPPGYNQLPSLSFVVVSTFSLSLTTHFFAVSRVFFPANSFPFLFQFMPLLYEFPIFSTSPHPTKGNSIILALHRTPPKETVLYGQVVRMLVGG